MRIPDCVSDLCCLQRMAGIRHGFQVLLRGTLRHKAHHCGDSLGDVLGGNNDDLLALCQLCRLGRCQNDVGVVRKNVDRVRVDLADGVQDILSAGIHRLSAFDHHVDADLGKDMAESAACGDTDKAVLFSFGSGGCFRFFLLLFLRGNAGRVLDQPLIVLLPHIVDLHAGQLSVGKTLLDREAGIIGMHMDLHEFVRRDTYDRIADGFQKCLELRLFLLRERRFKKDDELGTVSELDVGSVQGGSVHRHAGSALRGGAALLQSHFPAFSGDPFQCAFDDHHKALPAGIHNTGLFQNREKLRCFPKHFIARADHRFQKRKNIRLCLREFRGLLTHSPGNSEDGSFLRLHDGLVGCLRGPLHCSCEALHADIPGGVQFFCQSSEQLGENDAGIAACSPQRSGRDRLAETVHVRIFKIRDFPRCSHNGECHICSGISVRNRKNVQFIDPLFLCLQLICCGKESSADH